MKPDTAGVIAPPPLIYAAVLITGFLLQMAYPLRILPGRWAVATGLGLIGLGVMLAVFGFRAMSRVGTHVDPFKPTTALVTDGPFRFTRNPLYLALTLLYTGITSLLNALWPILLLPAAILIIRYGVIDREEKYLARKFGEEYMGYKKHVRRWI